MMTGDAVWEDEGGEAPGRGTQLPRLLPDVGRTGLRSPEWTPAQCPGRSQPLHDASAKGTPSYNYMYYMKQTFWNLIYMATLHVLFLLYNMICCDKCIHQNKSFSHRIGWQLSRNNILWLNWSWSTGKLNRKIVIDFLLCGVRFKWISNIKTSVLFLQEWRSSKSCRFMEQDL